MTLSDSLHLIAGLGALGMGGGMLLREPSRARNRSFALLCGALALWNLGIAGLSLGGGGLIRRQLFLLGSCATAPLALSFALALTGMPSALRRWYLVPASLLAALLWLTAASPLYRPGGGPWHWMAIGVLGAILLLALRRVSRHARGLPPGPERRALRGVFWGGVLAVLGGLSDFIPRENDELIKLGPPAILLFLLIVCAVIVRQRFLDLDLFLIRLVALIAGAATVALVFFAVARVSDRFVTLFLASMVVLAVVGPLGRVILAQARTALTPADPIVEALGQISRQLPGAGSRDAIQQIIEEGRKRLPEDVRLDIYLRRPNQTRFHLAFRWGGGEQLDSAPVPADAALPRLLLEEGLPLSRRYVAREAEEADGERRRLAAQALEQLTALDLRLVVPLSGDDRVVGWVGAGGGLSDRYLTSEVATGFLAVGHQALACLDRIEALEVARRQESLAAVGELAAGLAHEVRNPVAAIRGASQAMGPEATAEQRREMLDVIGEETERLGRVVGEFLDYARPGRPRREPVDLAELTRRARKGAELAGEGLEFELLADADAPKALGDVDQLRRVFENLMRNSWEAAGEGGRLRVEVYGADAGRVAVRFEDNGPGIPEKEMPRLFQPFHTTKQGGTGLGLALVHRIVEAHGGELHVEGRPGVGAVFTLLLPAADRGTVTEAR